MNPAFIILTFFILFLVWENMKTSTFSPDSNVAKSVSVLYGDYADEYGKFWGIPPERLLAIVLLIVVVILYALKTGREAGVI
jgi:hypothetical protein